MFDSNSQTDEFLRRLRAGDRDAIEAIAERTLGRFQILARRGLAAFPAVRRWEDSDDIVQGVALRLHKALKVVQPISARELLFLASSLMRRELIDLKRKHYGPNGIGANHASPNPGTLGEPADVVAAAPSTYDPAKLARWTELHETVADMPDDLRSVFDLIWYQELTHAQAAELLGVSVKSVQRRWREGRLRLHHLLDDNAI